MPPEQKENIMSDEGARRASVSLADGEGAVETSRSSSSSRSSTEEDPLDEWFLDRELEYWPNLPPEIAGDESFTSVADGTCNLLTSAKTVLYELVQEDLEWFAENIYKEILPLGNPALNQAATHIFTAGGGGKKIRPAMILLMSHALMAASCTIINTNHDDADCCWLLDAQRKLALAAEAAHTATLLHDDVIDQAATRRGVPAAHVLYGAKTAILAGDCLLAKIYILLAKLQNTAVITIMSTVFGHLVGGEVMQLGHNNSNRVGDVHDENADSTTPTSSTTTNIWIDQQIEQYLRKSFFKTASLMANCCKAAAVLGDYPEHLVQAAYNYGKHVGVAFQLRDDALDYSGRATVLGKPVHADLEAGLATGPVLFAAKHYPAELEPVMQRQFSAPGDSDLALELVESSCGIQQTLKLARVHAELAINAALKLPESAHRTALIQLAYMAVERNM